MNLIELKTERERVNAKLWSWIKDATDDASLFTDTDASTRRNQRKSNRLYGDLLLWQGRYGGIVEGVWTFYIDASDGSAGNIGGLPFDMSGHEKWPGWLDKPFFTRVQQVARGYNKQDMTYELLMRDPTDPSLEVWQRTIDGGTIANQEDTTRVARQQDLPDGNDKVWGQAHFFARPRNRPAIYQPNVRANIPQAIKSGGDYVQENGYVQVDEGDAGLIPSGNLWIDNLWTEIDQGGGYYRLGGDAIVRRTTGIANSQMHFDFSSIMYDNPLFIWITPINEWAGAKEKANYINRIGVWPTVYPTDVFFQEQFIRITDGSSANDWEDAVAADFPSAGAPNRPDVLFNFYMIGKKSSLVFRDDPGYKY